MHFHFGLFPICEGVFYRGEHLQMLAIYIASDVLIERLLRHMRP